MPTSAAGNKSSYLFDSCLRTVGGRCSRIWHQSTRGFTLLELLVVIAIMALATAGVGLAMRDTGQTALAREAERLAALLEAGRAQSRASGVAVRWRLTENGFAFEGLPVDSLPTQWLVPGIQAQLATADGRAAAALQLGPEPIIAAQQVQLTRAEAPQHSVRVASDGLRPFAAVTP